jgi:hypothetical protein
MLWANGGGIAGSHRQAWQVRVDPVRHRQVGWQQQFDQLLTSDGDRMRIGRQLVWKRQGNKLVWQERDWVQVDQRPSWLKRLALQISWLDWQVERVDRQVAWQLQFDQAIGEEIAAAN